MEDGDLRTRAKHPEQVSSPDSDNIKVRDEEEEEEEEEEDEDEEEEDDDDENDDDDKEAHLTRRNSVNRGSDEVGGQKSQAAAAAATAAPPPVGGRSPLNSIRQEQDGGTAFGLNKHSFKDRLPVRRPGPISDPELVVSVRPSPSIIARSISRSVSIRNTEAAYPESAAATGRAALLSEFNVSHVGSAAEQEADDVDEEDNGSSNFGGTTDAPAATEEQPVRVSLMALLGQTDGEWGDGSPSESPAAGADDDEEDDEDAAEENGSGMEYECCVCMVRHKGSAFIPCGHTFCRLCSRELWVSRGNCPLCNGYILEILDIF